MRKEFGETIADIVNKDKSVYVISADTGWGVFKRLQQENPDHFINGGLTEQAIVGLAAGMALENLKPWLYAITPFLLDRVYEQIKLDIVAQKANVKIVTYFDYPDSGPTHASPRQSELCDILGISYKEPKRKEDVRAATQHIYNSSRPFFMYLTKG